MDIAVLLSKLATCDVRDSIFYNAYVVARKDVDKEKLGEHFTKCAEFIKTLQDDENFKLNFSKLSEEADKLKSIIPEITRRDLYSLCDHLSALLGDKITQLCEVGNVFAQASGLEWCPYPGKFVVYSRKPIDVHTIMQVKFDNVIYNTIATSVEKNRYYEIWATLLSE